MAAPKRTPAERERDLALIADYDLQGLSAQLIADKLNARFFDMDVTDIPEAEREGMRKRDIMAELRRRAWDNGGVIYTITRGTIQNDIKENRKRYKERAAIATEVRVGEMEKRIIELTGVYHGAWERSKEKAERESLRVSGDREDPNVVKETEKETRVGDIAFLQAIERQHKMLIDLYALNAPTKVAITDATGRNSAPVTDEATVAALTALAGKVGFDVVEDGDAVDDTGRD